MRRPIEEQEFDQALRNTRLGKSSGPDGILPVILVNGGHCLRAFLLDLFNSCWVTEIIPLDCIDVNIHVHIYAVQWDYPIQGIVMEEVQ